MRPLVSIIVPVYNLESFLEQSIKSVLNQTCRNLELILINDGSSDRSGNICDDYAKKDERIIVKHNKNSGVSTARNIGMNMARGSLLLFLDGDDTLEFDTIEYIQQNFQKDQNLEMILGGFKILYNQGIVYADNKKRYGKGIEIIHEYGMWQTKIRIGSFAIKKEVVEQNDIFFHTSTKYGEDVEFINYCLLNAQRVKVTSKYFSSYLIHNDSAIAKVSLERFDCCEARNRTLKYIQDKYPDYKTIESLFKYYLVPEAIIDTTYLLFMNGISLFKINKTLSERNYYNMIHLVKDNPNTPIHIQKKINKFLRNPIYTWLGCFLLTQYYSLRQKIGLMRRGRF